MAPRRPRTAPDLEVVPDYLTAATSVRVVALDDLQTLPGNPRRGDVAAVARSLTTFGLRYPIVIRDGKITQAGNTRIAAARQLGWTHIAVCDADDLTPEQAAAFALADNRTHDLGDYDEEALQTQLERLDDDLRLAAGYGPDDDPPARPFYENFDDDPSEIDDLVTTNECPKCHYTW